MKRETEKKDINFYLNQKYRIEIMPIPEEDGGGYEARIPQLGKEAFRGYGETIEEALAHLEMVKKDLFMDYLRNNVPIPEPETTEEKFSGRILLRIPYYLHRELSELAKKENISLNQLLNHIIERGLASIRQEGQIVSISRKVLQTDNSWYKPKFEFIDPCIMEDSYEFIGKHHR